MIICKNCNHEISSNYCADCGMPAKLKRIDNHYILHEVEHVLHFERGIFYTIKELLLRPGKNVRIFISEDRNRLMKPIMFLIISSLLYTLVNHFFHLEDTYIQSDNSMGTTATAIFGWVQNHYGYANIIMGIFVAFWTMLFFRKYNYNFFEVLILLCFVIGVSMMLYSLFAIVEGSTGLHLMRTSGIITLLYCTWAIGQFFDKSKAFNYFKAFGAYLLGMITFTFAVILVGYLADLVIKR